MGEPGKKPSRKYYVLLYIFWFFITVTFTYTLLKPTVEGLIEQISGKKPPFISSEWAFWTELFTAILLAIVGLALTYFIEKRILAELAKRYRSINCDLIKEIGTESSDSAYLAYHTIVTHTAEMKKLVNKLISLPHHPQILRVLIDDYSKKANQSRFLVDFITFLKLGEILVENSSEMLFLNITPPYEWWDPLQFERKEEISKAIMDYKGKIITQMAKGAKVRRITIVDEKDALVSVLEHGYKKFFSKRMDLWKLIDEIPETFTKVFMIWMESIISRYDSNLKNEVKKTATEILNFCSNQDFNGFNKKFCPGGNPNSHFKKLSHEISKIVIDRFIELHKPEDEKTAALFICKDQLLQKNKPLTYQHAKEEGIFKDSDGNLYRLCMEETNGVGILLATIENIQDINDTYFSLLETKLLGDEAEQGRNVLGSLHDLFQRRI